VVLTDSIPLPPEKRIPQITTLSVAPLIGEAIRRIHRGESVGALFSSEVSLTQELTFWHDGNEEVVDARTGTPLPPDHVSAGHLAHDVVAAASAAPSTLSAGAEPARTPGDR
jgi:hypothetical protein